MFSKDALALLSENEYRITITDQEVTFKHSNGSRGFILFIGVLCSLATVPAVIVLPYFIGVLFPLTVLGFTFRQLGKIKGHTELRLTTSSYSLGFMRFKDVIEHKVYFNQIEEIKWVSKFIDSYASANKASTTEFAHQIIIKPKNQKEMELFQFSGDYEEPEAPFFEIYEWLKRMIQTGKI